MAASTLRHGADLPIVLMAVLLALRAQHDVLLGQPLVEGVTWVISPPMWRDRVVGRAPAARRQLASRARRHLHGRPRFQVDSALRRRVAERFAAACCNGNLDELVAVLAPDVTGEFDSAGLIPGAAAVTGADEVARTLAAAFIGVPAVFEVAAVNAAPGVLVRLGDRVVTVISLEISGDRVAVLHAIGNPAKLSRLNRLAGP